MIRGLAWLPNLRVSLSVRDLPISRIGRGSTLSYLEALGRMQDIGGAYS